jgi:hypothetical protein
MLLALSQIERTTELRSTDDRLCQICFDLNEEELQSVRRWPANGIRAKPNAEAFGQDHVEAFKSTGKRALAARPQQSADRDNTAKRFASKLLVSKTSPLKQVAKVA